jgi:hypothetical protein
MGQETSDSFR